MTWQTPVTDRTQTARILPADLNRIGDNINYLLNELEPAAETVLAIDADPLSPTFGHLFLQLAQGSKLKFTMNGGQLSVDTTDPAYVIDDVELTASTDERDTYTVTFTNTQTETFYTQDTLGLVSAIVKADYTADDFLSVSEFSEIIYWTMTAARKYGVMIYKAPDMAQTFENYNNIENLLKQCKDMLDELKAQEVAEKYAGSGLYVNNQYLNYVRGF